MDARKVSLIAGIFSFFNTIQFFIFELNQLTHVGFDDKYSIYMDTNSEVVDWVLNNRYKSTICLSITTILVSTFLLSSIYKNTYLGMVTYVLWIVTYELISFSLILVLHGAIKEQFKELSTFYLLMQISRMVLHFGCLPSVCKHGFYLYKGPKNISRTGRHRRASAGTVDSWKPARLGLLYHK